MSERERESKRGIEIGGAENGIDRKRKVTMERAREREINRKRREIDKNHKERRNKEKEKQ